jgi:uncharacterized membrane protein YgcG
MREGTVLTCSARCNSGPSKKLTAFRIPVIVLTRTCRVALAAYTSTRMGTLRLKNLPTISAFERSSSTRFTVVSFCDSPDPVFIPNCIAARGLSRSSANGNALAGSSGATGGGGGSSSWTAAVDATEAIDCLDEARSALALAFVSLARALSV